MYTGFVSVEQYSQMSMDQHSPTLLPLTMLVRRYIF